MKRNKILLINPSLGALGNVIVDIPVNLLYAASGVVKAGYNVKVLDFRVEKNWREALSNAIDGETFLIGISVMAGLPIKNVVEVSKFIKSRYKIPIVYGGPHPTIVPEIIIVEDYVDFVIRGYGSVALKELSDELQRDNPDFTSVIGLCWKKDGKYFYNPVIKDFENIHYADLPYSLFEKYFAKYIRLNEKDMVFPVYSSYGCPYNCSFCMASTRYKELKQKWMPLEEQYVIEHIKYLKDRYNAKYIYFYDDTGMVNRKKMIAILKRIQELNFDIKIGYRGIRIDELSKLSNEEFKLLSQVGVDKIHIGVESGSPRMLEYFNKKITIEQIIDVNRRLSLFPGISPHYNFLSGIPNETVEDLKMTKNLMMQLVKDNPYCIIFPINKYQPYPGSFMYEEALKHGFETPKSFEEWIDFDLENDIYFPWYTKEYNNYIDMLNLASYFIDGKLVKYKVKTLALQLVFKITNSIGKRILGWRLKKDFSSFLIENYLLKIIRKAVLT